MDKTSFQFREQAEISVNAMGGAAVNAMALAVGDDATIRIYQKLASGLIADRAALIARIEAGEFPSVTTVAPFARRGVVVPMVVPVAIAPAPKAHTVLPDAMALLLAHPDAVAVRGEYEEIEEIDYGAAIVSGSDIMSAMGVLVKGGYKTYQGRHHCTYMFSSLYGIDIRSKLAVILEVHGNWNSRKNQGSKTNDYYLVDMQTGMRKLVTHYKLRGEIRTDGRSPSAGVAGAVAQALGTTKAGAKKMMRTPGTRFLSEKVPTVADVAMGVAA